MGKGSGTSRLHRPVQTKTGKKYVPSENAILMHSESGNDIIVDITDDLQRQAFFEMVEELGRPLPDTVKLVRVATAEDNDGWPGFGGMWYGKTGELMIESVAETDLAALNGPLHESLFAYKHTWAHELGHAIDSDMLDKMVKESHAITASGDFFAKTPIGDAWSVMYKSFKEGDGFYTHAFTVANGHSPATSGIQSLIDKPHRLSSSGEWMAEAFAAYAAPTAPIPGMHNSRCPEAMATVFKALGWGSADHRDPKAHSAPWEADWKPGKFGWSWGKENR